MSSEYDIHPPLPPPSDNDTMIWLERMSTALGDTPETVIAQQWLREPETDALCVGDPADMEAIILSSPSVPGEPAAFGTSAEAVASLIPHLQPWFALNVPMNLADELMGAVAEAAGVTSVRLLDDVYHTLTQPVEMPGEASARLLGLADDALIRGAGDLLGDGAERLLATLDWGVVAGVGADGELVSVAYTFAVTERYADLGVVTRDDRRGAGFATAAAAIGCEAVQAGGRIPVGSTGGTNLASLRVARKLLFTEVSRRAYLIPEFEDDAS